MVDDEAPHSSYPDFIVGNESPFSSLSIHHELNKHGVFFAISQRALRLNRGVPVRDRFVWAVDG